MDQGAYVYMGPRVHMYELYVFYVACWHAIVAFEFREFLVSWVQKVKRVQTAVKDFQEMM